MSTKQPVVDSMDAPLFAILPPSQFASSLLQVSTKDQTILPFELVDLLNQVYFLHVLSTEPQKVLPPGKSLLSALSGSPVQHESDSAIRERVGNIMHKVFWDEAVESLSSPTPSSQLPRLKRLYDDLYTALSPLLPKGHTVLITLSSPLSPTSSPLLSAITHLGEAISSLRKRCAPARDSDLDNLLHTLDYTPPSTSTDELANMVVETVRSILDLADVMKNDLFNFALGSMTERQLTHVVADQAMSQERKSVLDLWGLERTRKLWVNWTRDLTSVDFEKIPPHEKWIFKLTDVLCSVVPVFCPIPTTSLHLDSTNADIMPNAPDGNLLPPPLFFLTPTLLYIQNYLQALVIAASLQSLVPRTSYSIPSQSSEHRYTFMSRIWTLLKAEIDGEPGSGETKVINLADEVVQAHRAVTGELRADAEQGLRSAVDRILHASGPVFILLQRRLSAALLSKLVGAPEGTQRQSVIPNRLRSGTVEDVYIGLGLPQDDSEDADMREVNEIIVKGFEDPVLTDAVRVGATQLKRCVQWTIRVWSDLINQR